MIDLRHPLAVLANRMPWAQIEFALIPAFARRNRQGHAVAGSDLFGTSLQIAGAGISATGRPRLPFRFHGQHGSGRCLCHRTVPSERYHERLGKRHKTLTDWASQTSGKSSDGCQDGLLS
jgi:hypothetical protein